MSDLRDTIPPEDLTEAQPNAAPDEGYDAWKEQKVRAALKQADDRSSMTPAKKVWERFGFER